MRLQTKNQAHLDSFGLLFSGDFELLVHGVQLGPELLHLLDPIMLLFTLFCGSGRIVVVLIEIGHKTRHEVVYFWLYLVVRVILYLIFEIL